MPDAPSRDYFDRARSWSAAVLLAAGAAAVIGSMLNWVTITERPTLREGAEFGDDQTIEAPERTRPFTGLEARDGWWVLGAGIVVILGGALLALRARAGYAWITFIASIVIGAVGFADYRGIGDLSSSLSQRMEVVGRAEPAIGITLVVAAAIVGVAASVVGVAASPREREAVS